MTVRIGFLGGLGEIGRNCAVLEIAGKLALIDCGLMFPEEDMLGVDLVLPDFSSVVSRRKDVACFVVAHGHEVWVQVGAGEAIGLDDAQYLAAVAKLASDAAEAAVGSRCWPPPACWPTRPPPSAPTR